MSYLQDLKVKSDAWAEGVTDTVMRFKTDGLVRAGMRGGVKAGFFMGLEEGTRNKLEDR